jgi:hypothetical protein
MKRIFAAFALLAGLMATAPAAAQSTVHMTFSGEGVLGDTPPTSADLTFTIGNAINAFGGYDILGVSGTVGGDTITGLMALEGPALCPCFPEGYAAGDGWFSVSNTLYLGGGPLFDHGGVGFQSASTWYNLWYADEGMYELDSLPVHPATDDEGYPLGLAGAVGGVAGVPEPASWAMFIGGFGLIGAGMRRRQAIVRFA